MCPAPPRGFGRAGCTSPQFFAVVFGGGGGVSSFHLKPTLFVCFLWICKVLSTNWKDIGKEKTPIKPPDGMEHKKYG